MPEEYREQIKRDECRKEAWKNTNKSWGSAAMGIALAFGGFAVGYHYAKIEAAAVWFLLTVVILAVWITGLPISKFYAPKFWQRLIGIVFITALAAFACYPFYVSEFKKQHAAITSGILKPLGAGTATKPIIEVADDGYTLDMSKASEVAEIRFLQDEHLRVEVENGLILVSTIIRDKDGRVLVKLEKNHWEVTPWILDKNYTTDMLEVKDARDRVVFSLRILPDRAQIEGEWRDDTGYGVRMAKPEPGMVQQGGMSIAFIRPRSVDPRGIGDALGRITPKFLYPSSEHWGELANSN